MHRVSFKTVGCRLNQAETAALAAQFEAAGYQVVPFGNECEVAVIHTCAITAKAERTCVRLARGIKRDHPAARVVLAGCAVEWNGAKLQEDANADLVVGQTLKARLPELMPPAPPSTVPQPAVRAPRFRNTRALVKVQDGCDFRCTYCVVPHTRGAPHGRPLEEIVAEIRQQADRGFREFVLTGANLGAYRHEEATLITLLQRAEKLPGVLRIRLSSIEISTVERAVIDWMADSEKMCRQIHLPLQSGSDRILRAMHRRYTSADYRKLVEYLEQKIPRAGLGTDLIVGFPGESPEAFEETVRMVEDLPFSNLHVFPYSIRPGTPAAALSPQVPDSIKRERAARLIALGETKRAAFAREFVGQKVSVLIERCHSDGRAIGWTGEYLEAHLRGPGLRRNEIVDFVPATATDAVLHGTV